MMTWNRFAVILGFKQRANSAESSEPLDVIRFFP